MAQRNDATGGTALGPSPSPRPPAPIRHDRRRWALLGGLGAVAVALAELWACLAADPGERLVPEDGQRMFRGVLQLGGATGPTEIAIALDVDGRQRSRDSADP